MQYIVSFLMCIICTLSCGQQFTWVQKTPFPGGVRYESTAFSINGIFYFCTGGNFTTGALFNDLWAYDPSSNSWTQKANLPGSARYGAAAFSIGNKGYVTTGLSTWSGGALNDLWEYDPTTNTWTQKANFPGSSRYDACGFTIGQKAYVGFGYPPICNDVYEYNPTSNSWLQIATFPGGARQSLSTFELNGIGYFCCGSNAGVLTYKDLWAYNPATNLWTQKADFPGGPRYATNGFALGGKGIVGGGCTTSQSFSDYYLYNPATNLWCETTYLPAPGRYAGDACAVNQNAFAGLGRDNAHMYYNDFWQMERNIPTITTSSQPCNLTVSFTSQAINPTAFLWSFGDGTTSSLAHPTHNYATAGIYNVQVIVYYNCSSDTIYHQLNIAATTVATAAFNVATSPCNMTANFSNTSTNALQYLWSFGDGQTSTLGTPTHNYIAAGNYTVTLLAISSCDTATATHTVLIDSIKTPDAQFTYNIDNCTHNVQFVNNSANANYYQWIFGDGTTSTQDAPLHAYTTTGNYTVLLWAIADSICNDSLLTNVQIENSADDSLYIPNCFTPNDDGINETFKISHTSVCNNYTVTILNRWGRIVFKTDDINQSWTGMYKAEALPEGIYVYMITSPNKNYTGTVTLLR